MIIIILTLKPESLGEILKKKTGYFGKYVVN